MKYFSLFSGIGGFEHGIKQAYLRRSSGDSKITQSASFIPSLEACQQDLGRLWDNASSGSRSSTICIGFSEIDKYATQIYKKHFPNHKEYDDVTNIKWSNIPDFELLCGGFPCQSFSIAGKRGGFLDTRGTLFFQIARAAQEKQPRLLLLENVKGLLSHDKGKTFGTILNTLDEIGYDLQWQVLNSKNFGVPQNRERVFIIGHLRTTPRPQIFPLRQTNTIYSKNNNRKIAKCLDSNYHKGWLDHGQRTMIKVHNMQPRSPNRPSLKYSSGGSGHLSRKDTAYCLDSGRTNAIEFGNMRIRRLTPTECERLQGFPDGWTEKGIDLKGKELLISDTQRYKCLGNAVTVNVIEAIMEKMIFSLTSPRNML